MDKKAFTIEQHRETKRKLDEIWKDAQAIFLATAKAYPEGSDVSQKAEQLLLRISDSTYTLIVALCIEDSSTAPLCFWNKELVDIYLPGVHDFVELHPSAIEG